MLVKHATFTLTEEKTNALQVDQIGGDEAAREQRSDKEPAAQVRPPPSAAEP